ncbi:YtxH domain-containing protein [Sorangium sp. So ce176]|uniref:YtxH domain-containing protein n=1 Tax=Sorangium sp. So ce176 TaxID=3133286 RepID=UPI003F60C365
MGTDGATMKATDLVNYMADIFPYRRRSSLDWIVPVAVGLGLGVAFGVLVAPTSGDEARRRLRDSAGRLRERAGRMRTDAERVAERAKDRTLEAAQRAQEQIQERTGSTVGERSFADDVGIR